MSWRAVISINHMACGATTGTVITGLIVRPHKAKQWIMQTGFLQIEKDRVGPVEGAESTLRQSPQRLARRLLQIREPKLQLFFASLFKNSQDISRLAQGET